MILCSLSLSLSLSVQWLRLRNPQLQWTTRRTRRRRRRSLQDQSRNPWKYRSLQNRTRSRTFGLEGNSISSERSEKAKSAALVSLALSASRRGSRLCSKSTSKARSLRFSWTTELANKAKRFPNSIKPFSALSATARLGFLFWWSKLRLVCKVFKFLVWFGFCSWNWGKRASLI